jgi:hypothetical protein
VKLARLLAFALLLAPAVACGGTHHAAVDPAAVARADANRRLTGTWLLTSFQPATSLEPMLALLLQAQIGHLTVKFDGQQMVVSGSGLSTTRRYTITQATGDQLSLTSFDAEGIGYNVRGELRGDVLQFESLSSPWRGQGTLQRLP